MDNINTIQEENTLNNITDNNLVNIPVIDYNSSNLPTMEQYFKYKNVLPIQINNKNKMQECFKYLHDYQFHDGACISNLLKLIYDFANVISSGYYTYFGDMYYSIDDYWEINNIYLSKNQKDRIDEYTAPKETTDHRTMEFKKIPIDLDKLNTILNPIIELQKQLYPTKYSNINCNFTNNMKKNSNVLDLFYVTSNKLIELSQDVICAMHDKIINRKDTNKVNIKQEIIDPLFATLNSISETLQQVINEEINLKLQNGSNPNMKEIKKTYKPLQHFMKTLQVTKDIQYIKKSYLDTYVVYSTYHNSLLNKNILNIEQKIREIIKNNNKLFNEHAESIGDNPKDYFGSKLFRDINDDFIRVHFEHQDSIKKKICNLQDITNEQIIESTNKYLSKIFTTINTSITQCSNLFSKKENNNVDKYKDEITKLKDDINKASTEYNKIPNEDYLSNIQEVLNSYK
ncbi:MAG: hypothetical protein IJ848_03020 [Alphaproteobacteria bacterium]|nr:hypothetical protein [Alphaproteobacteria bacterium]